MKYEWTEIISTMYIHLGIHIQGQDQSTSSIVSHSSRYSFNELRVVQKRPHRIKYVIGTRTFCVIQSVYCTLRRFLRESIHVLVSATNAEYPGLKTGTRRDHASGRASGQDLPVVTVHPRHASHSSRERDGQAVLPEPKSESVRQAAQSSGEDDGRGRSELRAGVAGGAGCGWCLYAHGASSAPVRAWGGWWREAERGRWWRGDGQRSERVVEGDGNVGVRGCVVSTMGKQDSVDDPWIMRGDPQKAGRGVVGMRKACRRRDRAGMRCGVSRSVARAFCDDLAMCDGRAGGDTAHGDRGRPMIAALMHGCRYGACAPCGGEQVQRKELGKGGRVRRTLGKGREAGTHRTSNPNLPKFSFVHLVLEQEAKWGQADIRARRIRGSDGRAWRRTTAFGTGRRNAERGIPQQQCTTVGDSGGAGGTENFEGKGS
ncbi:hypothetical protein B0H13DRAFT_1896009 [Mycena leptocephala]|nr:hypothetical protein B0H13DRAFT_1896009 [Mycena leptocephala]